MTASLGAPARPLPAVALPGRRPATAGRRGRRRQVGTRSWPATIRWYLTKWLRQMLAVIAHPEDGFWELKRTGDWWSVPFMLVLTILSRMGVMGFMSFHYIFQESYDPKKWTFQGVMEYFCRTVTLGMTQFFYGGNPEDTSIIQEGIRILVPFFTWCLAHYAIAMIFYGEGTLKNVVVSAAFSLTPFILFAWPGSLILTNTTTLGEKTLYFALSWVVRLWIFWLFVTHIRVIHDFSFGRTLGTYALSLVSVVIVWALAVLVYALSINTYQFFYEIFYELSTR